MFGLPVADMYDLARALHILSVIAWMAGLLMLPRFYAYHSKAIPGGELEHTMLEAERRLRSIILTPALIASWAFGIYLLLQYNVSQLAMIWLPAKLALVIALSGIHGFLVAQGRKFARGERPLTEKTWRMLNEVPFVIAIGVVLLVTLKPF